MPRQYFPVHDEAAAIKESTKRSQTISVSSLTVDEESPSLPDENFRPFVNPRVTILLPSKFGTMKEDALASELGRACHLCDVEVLLESGCRIGPARPDEVVLAIVLQK